MNGIALRPLSPASPDYSAFDRLNREAFPDHERVESAELFAIAQQGSLDIFGIYAGEDFAGLLVMRLSRRIAYIAFFAVCPALRSKGIGGKALQLLQRQYPERQVVVDFEAPDPSAPNQSQRLRRRAFYLRNGFYETGWFQYYAETEFEIFCASLPFDKPGFDAMLAEIHAMAPEFDPHPYRKDPKTQE